MSKKQGAKTTSQYTPDPVAAAAYKDVIGRAQDVVRTNPYQAYQGDLVAGFSPDQQSAFQNINATQGSVQPYLNTATGLALQSAQGVNPMQFSGQQVQQYMNPYIQNVVDTTQANINQNNAIQQNQLRGNAIAKGAFGGDRSGIAQAELARNQNLASQQTISGLYGQGYDQAANMFRNQQQLDYQTQLANAGLQQSAGAQIAGYGTTGQQAALQSAQAQLQAGTMQQALSQQELDKAYEQWQLEKQFPYQQTSWLANIINGTAGGLGGTTTQTQPAPSGASGILGALTAGLGLVSKIPFPSDERIKENAKPVGKMFDGTPIYKYNYKGEPEATHMGVMAQDIEKKYPEAVHHTPEGVKMVEYDAATREAADRGKFAGGGLAAPYGIFTDAMLQPITQARAQMPQVNSVTPQPQVDQKQIDAFAKGLGDASDNIKKRFFPAQSTEGVAPIPTERPDINTIAPPSPVQQSPLPPIPEMVPIPKSPPTTPFEANNLGFGGMFGFGAKTGGRINYAGGGLAEGVDPRDLAIRTILGEAANQGDVGQAAVAHVLKNRLNSGAYGEKLEDVILAPKQFSVWNNGDRAGDYARSIDPSSEQYQKAGSIFDAVQRGEMEDPTKGATHYANVNTVSQQRGGNLQPWLANMLNQPDTIQIGAHTFGKADAGRGVTSEGIQNALRAGADRERGVAPVQVADSSGQIGVAPTFDSGVTPSGVRTNLPIQNKASKSGILGALGIETTPEFNESLIAAGLGMMAGTSPYAGVNIGQGGLQGVQYYKDAIARQKGLAETGSNIATQAGQLQLQQMQNQLQIQMQLKQINSARAQAGLAPLTVNDLIGGTGVSSGVNNVTPYSQPNESAPYGAKPTTQSSPVKDALPRAAKEFDPEYWNRQAQLAFAAGDSAQGESLRSKALDVAKLDYFYDESGNKVLKPGVLATKAAETATGLYEGRKSEKLGEQLKQENEMVDQFKGRQIVRQRLDDLTDLLKNYQTGAWNDVKADLLAKTRALGFDIPDTATANAKAYQQFVKNQTANVFDQVKALGGRPLVAEIEGLVKANANPNLEPDANIALLGQAKGLLDYADKNYQDRMQWREENPQENDTSKFETQWAKENPIDKFVKEQKKSIPALGQEIPPADKREANKVYMTPKGERIWTPQGWVKP